MNRVCVVGLGPIGLAVARLVALDPAVRLAGLVDVDPAKVGTRPVASHDIPDHESPTVTDNLDEALGACDVAVLCTTSRFDTLVPVLRRCAGAGVSVVSSCEEMLWPRYRHESLADEVDRLAAEKGVAMLGTGVNPGFVMDWLPVVATFVLPEVSAVRVTRRVDAGTRRRPLQEKVGATLTVAGFEERRRAGTVGHKGMAESVAMVVEGLGLHCEAGSVEESLEPVLAESATGSALGVIEAGRVAGMRNVGRWRGEGLEVVLDLIMSVGWPEPGDEVEVRGPVPLRLSVEGGVPGDSATAAALANAARVIRDVRPGLRTMLDLDRVPSARASRTVQR